MSTPPMPTGGNGPAQKPAKPASTRRSLVAKAAQPMNPAVKAQIEKTSRITVRNARLMRALQAADPALPLDADTTANRELARQIGQALSKNKEVRNKLKANQGVARTGASLLTQGGQNENVKKAVKAVAASGGRAMAMPYGQYMGAVSTTAGEVLAINPGLKVGAQVLQQLGHVAQLFMNRTKDLEYQVMLVNNRLLVASNAKTAIASFTGVSLKTLLTEAGKTIVTPAPDDKSAGVRAYKIGSVAAAFQADPAGGQPLTQQQTKGADMLAEYESGYHIDHDARPDLQSLFSILQHQSLTDQPLLAPVSPADAVPLIGDSSKELSVISVQIPTKKGWHAEQALAMAIVLAGWNKGAAVGGTKLPCLVCWFTLSLANQNGYPLGFTTAPGYLWETNTVPGLTQVAQELHVPDVATLAAEFAKAQALTDNDFRQFMTALKPQSNLNVDVTTGGEALNARKLTQDQSQKSFSFRQIAPTPMELTGDDPGSPVGTYGTPPSSPGGQQDAAMEVEYQRQEAAWTQAQEKPAEEKKSGS